MNRQPFIVGELADKVLGFMAGMLVPVGLIAAVVVMYMWAGNGPTEDAPRRRNHAKSVLIWSGFGSLLTLALLAVFLIAIIEAIGHHPGL